MSVPYAVPRGPQTADAITIFSGVACRDLYDVLGVPEDSSGEAVKAVYRQLARTFHPDVNADPTAVAHFREITEAFLVLSDPEKRRAYDRQRRRRHRPSGEETEMYLGLRVAGVDLGAWSASPSSCSVARCLLIRPMENGGPPPCCAPLGADQQRMRQPST